VTIAYMIESKPLVSSLGRFRDLSPLVYVATRLLGFLLAKFFPGSRVSFEGHFPLIK